MVFVIYHINDIRYYWLENNTLTVPITLFNENLRRLCHRLRTNLNTPRNAWIILEGGKNIQLYNTDQLYGNFRQEPFFMWAFGVHVPDCIGLAEVATGNSYLFIPRPLEHSDWMTTGPIVTPADYKNNYQLTNVYYRDELLEFLIEHVLNDGVLLTLDGVNSDSGLAVTQSQIFKPTFPVKDNLLYEKMCELRAIKTQYEVDVMCYIAKISSKGHKAVMQAVRPGMMEYQCEAIFLEYIYVAGGCRLTPFTPVCSSGSNITVGSGACTEAVNNRKITKYDLCLFYMGASYCGYASAITCTFPAIGVFTDRQRILYNIVLESSRAILNILRAGQSLVTIKKLANHMLVQNLREIHILQGPIEQLLAHDLAIYFQPYNLVHFIGLDVHDVGGYLPKYPKRPKERGLNKLRTARVLEPGMIISINPSCYFTPKLIDELRNNVDMDEFIDWDTLNNFRELGGVRIGDMVHITHDACVVLSQVPRTVEEIETFMNHRVSDPNTEIVEMLRK